VALYPLRRRWTGRSRIDVRGGISFSAPLNYPLFDVFREVWSERNYALKETRVPPGSWIIDLGANIGLFTVWAARTYPQARILAIEPARSTYAHLLATLARNGSDARTLRAACAGRSGKVQFHESALSPLNSLYRFDAPEGDATEVDAVPLDTLFERYAVEHCALLKCDVEGAEYEIFLNTSPSTFAKIGAVVLEYHLDVPPSTPEQLEALFASHGFRVSREQREPGTGYLRAWREETVA
jgi:FkbM family methyltransferase